MWTGCVLDGRFFRVLSPRPSRPERLALAGAGQGDGALGDEGDRKAVSVPSDEADTSKIEQYVDDPGSCSSPTATSAPYVRLRSPAKGSTTSSGSSATTRSELREMHHPDGDRKSAWDAAGSTVHNLKVRLAVTKVMEKNGKRSRVAVAQVHKTTEDGILVYLDGESGKLRWKQDSEVQDGSLGDYTLGQYVNIGLSVRDGKCTIYVDDVAKAEGRLTGRRRSPTSRPAATTRTTTAPTATRTTSFNEVHIAAVTVQHGVPWASGGYEPIGPGVGATQGGEPEGPQEPQIGDRQQAPRPDPVQRPEAGVEAQPGHQRLRYAHRREGRVRREERRKRWSTVSCTTATSRSSRTARRCGSAPTSTAPPRGAPSYPRTELREMKPATRRRKADWEIKKSDGTVRRLTARVKVTRAPSTAGPQPGVDRADPRRGTTSLQIMYDGKKKVVGYTWPSTATARGSRSCWSRTTRPATAGSPTASRSQGHGPHSRSTMDRASRRRR